VLPRPGQGEGGGRTGSAGTPHPVRSGTDRPGTADWKRPGVPVPCVDPGGTASGGVIPMSRTGRGRASAGGGEDADTPRPLGRSLIDAGKSVPREREYRWLRDDAAGMPVKDRCR